ncbi:MAG: DUF2807 domain-containing protein [Bacteroidetes bacterium]|nr:MAG: DUF2807 domain-containing protein [Bacteroidota bacterium]MBL1145198.1 DUF2807 domain-containing protein [Bacteroidota bacterium]NOG57994.1 DUF2807 domain-containing protein [Bacteroidota bacterium]
MRLIKFISLFIFFASITSCKKENMGDCFKSTGKIVEEQRQTADFYSIEVEDRINLHLTQSNQRTITVKAGKNLQEFIDLSVQDNTLYIKNNNRCNWVRSFKKEIDIYISLPEVHNIVYRGGGDVELTNTFTQTNFALDMWKASGNIYLSLNCDYVSLKSHAGTADITCNGTSNELILYTNGNGFINAENLQAKKALAINKNTGQLVVRVSDELKAEIKGSGNIEYFGNPTIDLTKTGTGNLIHR